MMGHPAMMGMGSPMMGMGNPMMRSPMMSGGMMSPCPMGMGMGMHAQTDTDKGCGDKKKD